MNSIGSDRRAQYRERQVFNNGRSGEEYEFLNTFQGKWDRILQGTGGRLLVCFLLVRHPILSSEYPRNVVTFTGSLELRKAGNCRV